MVRVLIVGAGVTGSLCSRMLRQHLPTQLQCQIVVWEKSRGVGGRMSLSKTPQIGGSCSAELGAQYFTQNLRYKEAHKSFYDELLECDVLQPFNKGKIENFRGDEASNFVSKNGLGSVAKHFFATSSVEICRNLQLESLRLTSESDDSSDWLVWEAVTAAGQQRDHFDAIILTMPIPQILGIEGVRGFLDQAQINNLKAVEYSSRFALGMFYKPGDFELDLPYALKYIQDSEIVKYIALDHVKRGTKGESASVVVHTSVPFGKAHLEEDSASIGPTVLKELRCIVPDLPEPDHVKYHKWRYSQVTRSSDVFGCMVANTKPLLLLAGDGFTHSNFDGCIESALEVNRKLGDWVEACSRTCRI